MNKRKYALFFLCALGLTIGAFAFASAPKPAEHPQASSTQHQGPPDHVIYRMLLHDMYLRLQEAAKAESQGNHALAISWRTAYQLEAALSDEEELALERIANECEQEVEQQDALARVITDVDLPPGGRVTGLDFSTGKNEIPKQGGETTMRVQISTTHATPTDSKFTVKIRVETNPNGVLLDIPSYKTEVTVGPGQNGQVIIATFTIRTSANNQTGGPLTFRATITSAVGPSGQRINGESSFFVNSQSALSVHN